MSLTIFFVTLFSLFVVLSYILVPRFFPNIPMEKLWGGISDPRVRILYMVSIGLSAIAFLMVYAYFVIRESTNLFLFWSLMGFLGFSLLWMPFMYLSLRFPPPTGPYKYFTPLVLGLVAFFALTSFYVLFQNQRQDQSLLHFLAVISAGYLLIHTLFLDFILFTIADIV